MQERVHGPLCLRATGDERDPSVCGDRRGCDQGVWVKGKRADGTDPSETDGCCEFKTRAFSCGKSSSSKEREWLLLLW